MADVARPETAAFVKAMRQAELLRVSAEPGYQAAVVRLEIALRCAEMAAGVPRPGGGLFPAEGIHRPGTAAP